MLSGAGSPVRLLVAAARAQEALDVGDELISGGARLIGEELEALDVGARVLVARGGRVKQIPALEGARRELADWRIDSEVATDGGQGAIDAAGYVALT